MRVITIGTSQNGATSSEVDFLCSGTNDSQMIASAIDALPLTGGLIKFQPGTYNLTQEMVLDKESVTICGSGNSTVLKREYQNANSDTALVKIEMDKCTIKDIYIHYGYNKRPTSSATSVKGIFSEGYFTTIQNVYFSNSKINLEDTLIDDIYAVHLTGTQSIVEDCIFEKNYSEEALRCIVCEGNDCIIANNRLHNLRGDTSTGGIYCSGSNCIIDSNTISGIITDGSVIGIRCAGNSCTIHGNTCIGSDSIIKTAIGFYIEGDNNTVSGNQIKSMISQQYSAQGIWSIGTGNTLSGNTCVDNYTNDSEKDGTNLYVNGDNNTVTGNTCTVTSSITTPFANIKIDSEKSIFVGNRAVIADGLAQNYTSEQYSIFLESNAYYNMITDNVCLGKDIAKLNPTQNDYNYIANNKTELEQVYEENGISDAPSDDGVYGRKNGAWENLTAEQYYNQKLINFKYVSTDSNLEEITDLDHLPNGMTVVPWADGPGLGSYFVFTALEEGENSSKSGYQIRMTNEKIEQRYCYEGSWTEWSPLEDDTGASTEEIPIITWEEADTFSDGIARVRFDDTDVFIEEIVDKGWPITGLEYRFQNCFLIANEYYTSGEVCSDQALLWPDGRIFVRTNYNIAYEGGEMIGTWSEYGIIKEAPKDGNTYARKDGEWEAIAIGMPIVTLEELDTLFTRGIYELQYT